MDPLVAMVPIEPAPDGNGLAMRAALVAGAASSDFSVVVLVVPVAGSTRHRPTVESLPMVVVPLTSGGRKPTGADFLATPHWRSRLESALPFPGPANRAPPTMLAEVCSAVSRAGVAPGAPIHVMRSYLAPLGLALAERLGSPWCTLDLDDDDEALAASLGHGHEASAYHRLVATFGPLFDGVCVAAPLEAAAIRHRFGFDVAVVRNTVVVPAEVTRDPVTPTELVFVGNLDYPPNAAAATTLAGQIAPALAATLHRPVNVNLVGPFGPSVQALGRLPGVRVTGYVDDLAPFYERASAVVVPLAHGSGTSIKVLEAFAREVPVVSTRAGVRGLEVEDGIHVLLGESTDELVSALARLVGDPDEGRRLARSARDYVERRHGAHGADGEVIQLLRRAAGRSGGRASEPDPRRPGAPGTGGSP
jgi:hypothetical protein